MNYGLNWLIRILNVMNIMFGELIASFEISGFVVNVMTLDPLFYAEVFQTNTRTTPNHFRKIILGNMRIAQL